MTTDDGKVSARWHWLILIALVVAEFWLFDSMTSRHHANIYPRWNDQIQYLSEAYKAFEIAKTDGFFAGIKATLTKTSLQGCLHDLTALFVFKIAGSASRSAALSLNMLVFIAWQIATYFTLVRLTGSRSLGWLGFGLLLCLAWPWSGDAGSAVDFRLDHAAMCLFGISALVALLTNGYRHRGWSLVFGTVVALTMLERFLTGAYFAVIYLMAAVALLVTQDRWKRLSNLILSGLLATAIALPIFWFNREAIYTYYWVGHVAGAEGDARFLGLDLLHSLQFVTTNLARMHLGTWWAWTAATAMIAAALLWLGSRRCKRGPVFGSWLFVSLLWLIAPIMVLSVHRQKSAYVLGVVVPGVLLLAAWLYHQVVTWIDLSAASAVWHRARSAIAAAVVVSGLCFFTIRQCTNPHDPVFARDARIVNNLADHIYKTAQAQKITTPAIGVDQVVDFIDAQILGVVCYERHKVWYSFVTMLPNSILTEPDEVIRYKLNLCDFIILTDRMDGGGHWPYDQQMRRLYPELRAWCDEHRQLSLQVSIFGRDLSLYQRPEFARE